MQRTHKLYVDYSMLRIDNQRYKMISEFFMKKNNKNR